LEHHLTHQVRVVHLQGDRERALRRQAVLDFDAQMAASSPDVSAAAASATAESTALGINVASGSSAFSDSSRRHAPETGGTAVLHSGHFSARSPPSSRSKHCLHSTAWPQAVKRTSRGWSQHTPQLGAAEDTSGALHTGSWAERAAGGCSSAALRSSALDIRRAGGRAPRALAAQMRNPRAALRSGAVQALRAKATCAWRRDGSRERCARLATARG
jgi:hypothetical protein